MKTVLHISDWHSNLSRFKSILRYEAKSLPPFSTFDAVFLTGDMLPNFEPRAREPHYQRQEWEQIADYLEVTFPGADIFAIRGNHDYIDLGGLCARAFDDPDGDRTEWAGMKMWGFRGVTPLYGAWEDELAEKELARRCSRVPEDTEILVTHCPPYGVLDDARVAPDDRFPPQNIGSRAIRDLVERLPRLKLHVFGHCHEAGGQVRTIGQTIFSNAACTANLLMVDI